MDEVVSAGKKATEELFHYGVKGMKWGVRKKRKPQSRVEVSTNKKGKLKTTGGENRKASEDAKKAAVIGQIAKASGYQALSNAQLRAYTERMALESRTRQLEDEKYDTATKIVKSIIDEMRQKSKK